MGTKFWLKTMGVLSIIGGIIGGFHVMDSMMNPFTAIFGIIAGFLVLIAGICGSAVCNWLIHMLNHAELQTNLLTESSKEQAIILKEQLYLLHQIKNKLDN